jgi:hypothetical protein
MCAGYADAKKKRSGRRSTLTLSRRPPSKKTARSPRHDSGFVPVAWLDVRIRPGAISTPLPRPAMRHTAGTLMRLADVKVGTPAAAAVALGTGGLDGTNPVIF